MLFYFDSIGGRNRVHGVLVSQFTMPTSPVADPVDTLPTYTQDIKEPYPDTIIEDLTPATPATARRASLSTRATVVLSAILFILMLSMIFVSVIPLHSSI